MDKYFDKEKNRMQPIICEECGTHIGYCNWNEYEEIKTSIWCEYCAKVELKEEK